MHIGERWRMRLITLYMPEPYIQSLDQLVNEKYYPNRAEAIRVAVRDLLSSELWSRFENSEQNPLAKQLPNCEL